MGGLLCILLLPWTALIGLIPDAAYRLSPRFLRTNKVTGIGGPVVLIAWVLTPMVMSTVSAIDIHNGPLSDGQTHQQPLVLTIPLACLVLGLPMSLLAFRAWRVQRMLILAKSPAPELGLHAAAVACGDVVAPTPLPAQSARRLEISPYTDARIRKVRTVVIATAICLYLLLRMQQVSSGFQPSPSAFLLDVLVSLIAVACALYAVLKFRHWLSGSDSVKALATQLGWLWAPCDAGTVGRRFPQLPILVARRKGEVVSTRQVAWGTAGERQWWAIDTQGYLFKGASGSNADRRRTVRRACIVVSLPGVRLPRTVVAGKDLVGIREWVGDSMLLESEAWNDRFWIYAAPGKERVAHALLHPRAMEHILAELPDGMVLLLAGDAIAVWRSDPLRSPDLVGALRCALGLADLLPEFVVSDYGTARR